MIGGNTTQPAKLYVILLRLGALFATQKLADATWFWLFQDVQKGTAGLDAAPPRATAPIEAVQQPDQAQGGVCARLGQEGVLVQLRSYGLRCLPYGTRSVSLFVSLVWV